MQTTLIADSGSTKTDWCLTASNGKAFKQYSTQGINPYQQTEEAVSRIISQELVPQLGNVSGIAEIFFYGAGCRDEMRPAMSGILKGAFPAAHAIEVNSDLLAAARSLCGEQEGIACILGTGSNSCLYDGKQITANIPPLGYILGDEGSGAALGRNFVNALFKDRLPKTIAVSFSEEMRLPMSEIIRRVYKEPMANRFLASLSLFIGRHINDCDALRNLVIDNFRLFFRNNIKPYSRCPHTAGKALKVNAIGSMAYYYRDEFKAAAALEGFQTGRIERSPMVGLANFHTRRRGVNKPSLP